MTTDTQSNKTKPTGSKASGCVKSCLALFGSLTGILLLVILLPILAEVALWGLGTYLVIDDTKGKVVDAVVVLSGGTGDERLAEAAKIYNNNYAEWIILTEASDSDESGPDLATSVAKELLVSQYGIPDQAIIITERHVSSTWSEARVVMKLMLREGLQSCIVVTDPFHTRRSRVVFREEFLPRDLTMYVYPAGSHWYAASTWWLSPEGRDATFREYAKLFAFQFLGLKQD
jgi:uncharacterized SAM-binding protein YcdF (DUF218 family)